jgi:hypothetical protein
MLLRRLTLLGTLGLLAAGCGAFADASQEDGGGQPPYDSTLSFFVGDAERETLRQGQVEEFRIVFDTPPPWTAGEGGHAYRTRFDFEKDGQVLEEDVSHVVTSYDGLGTLTAILGADLEDPTGERKVYIDLAFEKSGQRQRLHRGQGLFYVLPPHDPADGGDGAGGAE